ncbi:p21 protein (Cdc42 Rac)-activated kinase [Apophysomyces sp. BC1034]|nr:p21 protein (Cdc42 Rac)-activated kinase [Apophysomyces sp. BC1021]KAG0192305.1 p21 protein (Cdc42 Rac)-activated kinase [Apophysomyces sp. BC1034]
MGNTLATPTNATTANRHPPDRRQRPVVKHAIRKYESSSALSTLGRIYFQSNPSSTTINSKAANWRKDYGGKIMDIGKPTQFEHGVHVEYNKENGKYMGLPDVWQASLPSDDILDTQFINPNLVPSPITASQACASLHKSKNHGSSILTTAGIIGKPYNVQHNVHVQVDLNGAGYIGLPPEWQRILTASGVSEDLVKANPKTTKSLMRLHISDALRHKGSRLPHTGHNDLDTALHEFSFQPRSSKHVPLPMLTTSGTTTSIDSNQSDASISRSTTHLSLDSCFLDDLVDTAEPSLLYSNLVLIAEGESGPMFAATQIATNQTVAIKKIPLSAGAKLSKIRSELTTMKMSRHPNVVEYIASYKTDDALWVVMECMDAALSDILSVMQDGGSAMRESQIARIARDILRALCRIHRLRRIHRDIRSDNVLINRIGEVKLADFGYCAQLTEQQPKRTSVVGTPYWMSPEVIKGEGYDTKADIWSLGVLMIEIAQGEPPYIEHPPLRALFLIASNGAPSLQEPHQWSEDFKDFIRLCTTMNPSDRPDAETLSKHPFLSAAGTTEEMIELIEQTQQTDVNDD